MGNTSHSGVKLPGRGVIAHFLGSAEMWMGWKYTASHLCPGNAVKIWKGHTKFGPYDEKDTVKFTEQRFLTLSYA